MAQALSEYRKAERLPMVLPARCRSRTGFLDRVVITDLSIFGCRIESFALTMRAGDLVIVRPEGIEGLCGVVRWVNNHAARIEFDKPLYQPVADHLTRKHASFRVARQDRPFLRTRLVA